MVWCRVLNRNYIRINEFITVYYAHVLLLLLLLGAVALLSNYASAIRYSISLSHFSSCFVLLENNNTLHTRSFRFHLSLSWKYFFFYFIFFCLHRKEYAWDDLLLAFLIGSSDFVVCLLICFFFFRFARVCLYCITNSFLSVYMHLEQFRSAAICSRFVLYHDRVSTFSVFFCDLFFSFYFIFNVCYCCWCIGFVDVWAQFLFPISIFRHLLSRHTLTNFLSKRRENIYAVYCICRS